MINLYKKLGVKATATPDEIKRAMQRAAQNQSMNLTELQKCKEWILNEEVRRKYNAKLFAEHPELLLELQAPQPSEQKEAKRKRKKSGDFFYSVWFLMIVLLLMIGSIFGYVSYQDYVKEKEAEAKKLALDETIKSLSQQLAGRYKNPSGVQYKNLKLVKHGGNIYLCGLVNAQNGFGGYSGFHDFTWTPSIDEWIITLESRDIPFFTEGSDEVDLLNGEEIIRRICTKKALEEVPAS